MRVAIFCVGTRGDVQPFLALGAGLRARGHEVVICTATNFAAMIRDAGLDHAPLTADYDRLMRRAPEMIENGMNVVRGGRIMARYLAEMAAHWPAEGRAAALGADLLIGQGPATVLAGSLSQALGIPVVQAQLQPMTPCRDIPPMVLPPLPVRLPGAVNRGLYHALRWFMWSLVRGPVNRHLRAPLGLADYAWQGPQHDAPRAHRRTLYAYSPAILPRSRDWTDDIAVTGYWFHDRAQAWTPPEPLVRFLEAGPKPIYIGFGSMFARDAEPLAAAVIASVRQAGQRAVIARGWGGIAVDEGRDDPLIHVIGEAPHDWLLPRMAAAVHHGGAGTTAAAIRAGIPSLILPFITEQAFWSVQLERAGVAVPRIARKAVTPDRLAQGYRHLLAPAIAARARALGERIAAEDGVGTAIAQLEAWGLLRAPVRQPVSAAMIAD
ncbi:glycosyltransferase [Acidiphilium acidophilum]|uniref:glycosyltransferase n=1 Tax=Acidiphilium acidophilum TaxID=76588 RepID=UPI002E8E6864|nr:glycosyltransferase [Acidiphilium acidophilum]